MDRPYSRNALKQALLTALALAAIWADVPELIVLFPGLWRFLEATWDDGGPPPGAPPALMSLAPIPQHPPMKRTL